MKPVLFWPTEMRRAFIAANPKLGKRRVGMVRKPAWSVERGSR